MTGDAPDDTAATIDLLASEYGWPIEYVQSLAADVVAELIHAILYRKGVKVFRVKASADVSRGSLTERIERIRAAVDTLEEVEE